MPVGCTLNSTTHICYRSTIASTACRGSGQPVMQSEVLWLKSIAILRAFLLRGRVLDAFSRWITEGNLIWVSFVFPHESHPRPACASVPPDEKYRQFSSAVREVICVAGKHLIQVSQHFSPSLRVFHILDNT